MNSSVRVGEMRMRSQWKKTILVLVALAVLMLAAQAEQTISTSLVMRVSHLAQNAVVDAGEDLSMEVNIDGVTPASYQWYFNNTAIEGANQKVYNVINAQVDDSGIYRLDAFDENGRMVASMDITARVLDPEVPQAGDRTLPVPLVLAAMGLAAATLLALRRRGALN